MPARKTASAPNLKLVPGPKAKRPAVARKTRPSSSEARPAPVLELVVPSLDELLPVPSETSEVEAFGRSVVDAPEGASEPLKPAVIPSVPPVEEAPRGVVGQVRMAFRPANRLAMVWGFLLGGLVPLASYVVAHVAVPAASSTWKLVAAVTIVAGCLAYSAKTVYQWARIAFRDGLKAFGFTVLLEGVMTFVDIPWLAITCLAYLIVINGIATGVNLVLGERE